MVSVITKECTVVIRSDDEVAIDGITFVRKEVSHDLLERLWASDAASALTNEAAREIEELRSALKRTILENEELGQLLDELHEALVLAETQLVSLGGFDDGEYGDSIQARIVNTVRSAISKAIDASIPKPN